jgi:predicted PurR-regulated permease PerM
MQRIWPAPFRYIVLAALLLVVAALLWYVRSLLQPLLAASVIAYVLSPAAGFLMVRLHASRKFAATLVYFATLAALLLLVGTLVPIMLDQIQSIRTDLQSALIDLQALLASPFQFGVFRLDLRLLPPSLAVLLDRGAIVPQPSQALRFLELTSRGVVWAAVIMVVVYYLMTEWDELRRWIIGLAPPSEQSDLRHLYLQVRDVWAQYLRGQLRLIFILGIIYAAGWGIIGVPGALALGLLAGLLNLIPEVGPAIVGILATLIAYLEGSHTLSWLPNLWFAALTLGVYLLINAVKSVWLQPRILGRSVLLHEGLVFVAIVAALVLSGILGVLVIVPVLASAIIVGKYLRRRLLGMPPFDEEPNEASARPVPASAIASKGHSESAAGESGSAAPSPPTKNP